MSERSYIDINRCCEEGFQIVIETIETLSHPHSTKLSDWEALRRRTEEHLAICPECNPALNDADIYRGLWPDAEVKE